MKGAPIEVAFEQGSPPAISGRSAEIREVMTNLILNAVDALARGRAHRRPDAGEPGRAVVSVSDSGVGMSDDVKRRAFEPFFTTKGVKRTGLGLAVAYGTIRRHGGQVDSRERGGRGHHRDLLASRRRARPAAVRRGSSGSAASSSSTTRPTCASWSPTC